MEILSSQVQTSSPEFKSNRERMLGLVKELRERTAAVREGGMARGCRKLARSAAVHSTCGKPGAVTCCRTKESGATSCSVKRQPESCRAPRGGSACVASATSCADACSDTGCASPSGAFLD